MPIRQVIMLGLKMAKLASASVILLLSIGVVYGQQTFYCCGFDDDSACHWTNAWSFNQFKWTGSSSPNLTSITDFQSHNSESAYFQNTALTSGTAAADFLSPTLRINDGDIISVDFYVHQAVPDGSVPIALYFDDDQGRSTVLVLTKAAGWRNQLSGYCGGANLCCTTYPCSGKLRVHGVLTTAGDLLAFDNVQINQCALIPTTGTLDTSPVTEPLTSPTGDTVSPTDHTDVSTDHTYVSTDHTDSPTNSPTGSSIEPDTTTTVQDTTTEPTLPPPPPSSKFCCSFETGCPNWEITGWQLSVDKLPDFSNTPAFHYDSQYAWNQQYDAGKIRSPEILGVLPTTNFALNYYADSSLPDVTNTIIVYFIQTNENHFTYLSILGNTNGQWNSLNVTCGAACCNSYPCRGQLVIEASIGPGQILFAVDNVEVNDGCIDSSKCCQFNDADICGIINTDSAGTWKWSGISHPDTSSFIPEFTSDGNYLWYQNFNVDSDTAGQVSLRTGLLTATTNTVFTGSFYVNNTDEQHPLTLQFRKENDGTATILEYISDSYGTWITVSVDCASLHGNCCYPDDKCDGYLEVIGLLRSSSDDEKSVFYAVDSIDVDNECSVINN